MSGRRAKIGILVSGNGTNLQAILDSVEQKKVPAEVAVVISNKAEAFALERAHKKGVPTKVVSHADFPDREAFENRLISELEAAQADLVVLAGFMRVLSPHFVKHFAGRILNIHPALLPSFPGTHAIAEAWDYGVRVTGVTVHFVDEGTDTGPIILQEPVTVSQKETLESLEEKIHSVEHRLFPEAIRLFAEGRLHVEGRKVEII